MSARIRIPTRFAALKAEGRAGLVTFVTAGDPDYETSLRLVKALPAAGADVIELGVAFSDPTADGPAIQASGLRALQAGITLKKTLKMVAAFRETDDATPIVLMGYFNPILRYGLNSFVTDAAKAGVDGLIVVDLPAEEDAELREPARVAGLDFVRLATPTTDESRLKQVLTHASGFVYYVAVAGITGTHSAEPEALEAAVKRLKAQTDLPVAVGFGIRTPAQAAEVAGMADAAVVGSAIVERIAASLDDQARAKPDFMQNVLDFVRDLAKSVRK